MNSFNENLNRFVNFDLDVSLRMSTGQYVYHPYKNNCIQFIHSLHGNTIVCGCFDAVGNSSE